MDRDAINEVQIFLKWLYQHDVESPKVALRHTAAEGRGLFTKEKVFRGETLIKVPLSQIITLELSKESSIGQKIVESEVPLASDHSIIAAFMLIERAKEHSFWHPYLHTLPKHFNHVPVTFNDDECLPLKGSYALTMLRYKQRSLREEYERLVSAVPDCGQFSLEGFIWARTAIITRIFGFFVNEQKTKGMVPFADMCNHGPGKTRWFFSEDSGCFEVEALQDLEKGDKVPVTYGTKCNSRFFVNYGFVLPNNEANEAQLTPEFTTEDLKPFNYDGEAETFKISKDYTEKTKGLFYVLRLRQIAQQADLDWAVWAKNPEQAYPTNRALEQAILSGFVMLCQKALDAFETTLEQDSATLKLEGLTPNLRNSILMRQGEKEVLHALMEHAKDMKTLLLLSDSLFLSLPSALETHPWAEYLTEVLQAMIDPGSPSPAMVLPPIILPDPPS